jgi:nascent polypeptide-associated complex subunit beta
MAIYGNGQDKDLTELVPGILNQLGPDSLASLRKLAESYQNLTARQNAEKKAAGGDAEGDVEEADDVPDLVENFDDVEEADGKKEEAKLEELA